MDSTYKELPVWQKAEELAREVYFVTQDFPRETSSSVVNQLRKAALSVPSHIVEGAKRRRENGSKQFFTIAFGSLAETEYLLEFCFRLKYIEEDNYCRLESLRKEVGGLLWNLYHGVN